MHALVAEVLAAWRRAERLADQLEQGTPEQQAAVDASARLRDLYGDLTNGSFDVNPAEVDAVRRTLEEASRLP